MKPNKNPTSAYDILYHGMSKEDREKITKDFDAILVKSAQEAEKILLEGVQKAVSQMYEARTTNPWLEILRDCNADAYGFLSTLTDQLWKSLLKSNPKSIGCHDMQKLIHAWRENYPTEFFELVNKELADENARLREAVKYRTQQNDNLIW